MNSTTEDRAAPGVRTGVRLEGLSLFFPCYNEEANVQQLVHDALQAAGQATDNFEIIVVDDGSRDRTAEITQRIAAREPRVRLVRHAVNRGYGEALKSGFRAARFPWVFYSDGDRQFDLTELARLVNLTPGADIVSGYRIRRADAWHRSVNAKIFQFALRLFMGLRVPDVDCAFKIYRRDLFSRMSLKTTGAMIDAEILSKALQQGSVIKTLGVYHRPRLAGSSTGSRPGVILKAMKEFWMLWWDLAGARWKAQRTPVSKASDPLLTRANGDGS